MSAGVVATTTGADVKLRRFLAEDSLEVVVSLLAGAFEFYFGIRGGLLLLGQKLARQTNGIPFPKITAAGFNFGDKSAYWNKRRDIRPFQVREPKCRPNRTRCWQWITRVFAATPTRKRW